MDRLSELQAHHAQCLEDYVRFWRIPEERDSVEMSVEEAAYYFLKHAGMLYRFTGDRSLFDLFDVQERSERRELALDACRYILGATYVEQARRALEPPDAGELDELEFVLMKRDDLRVVMEMIAAVCRDVIESDTEVQNAFGDAVSAEAKFDDVLQEHRSRVAFAALPLRDLAVNIQIPLNSRQWWYKDTIQWEQDALRHLVATLTDGGALDEEDIDATVAPKRQRLVARRPDGVLDLKDRLVDLTEAFQRQFRQDAMHAIAASSDEREERVLWDSKQDLRPLRIIVYHERNGDLRFDVTSTEANDENQTCEVVVEEQKLPTVTFRRDPETGELFGEARIPRDELREVDLSKLTFRLKRL